MDFAPIPPCYLYPSPPDHSKIGHCSQIQLELPLHRLKAVDSTCD